MLNYNIIIDLCFVLNVCRCERNAGLEGNEGYVSIFRIASVSNSECSEVVIIDKEQWLVFVCRGVRNHHFQNHCMGSARFCVAGGSSW